MLSEHRSLTVNTRVSAFLESQHGLMSYYAAEGKAAAATWPKQSSGDSRPGSPMLVPRVAAAHDNGFRTIPGYEVPNEPGPSFPIDESSIIASQKPRPVKPSKSTRVVPVKTVTSRRKSMDRDQGSDDEPERLQRLEQRRNRRRARRYAMNLAEGATDRGDDASEIDVSHKASKRQKLQPSGRVEKKRRKTKTTPALLLMQNFSCQNLGKSRLTMRPSPTVGVFNKGKNSGKVAKKNERRERLVPDIVFSESRFLNKAAPACSSDEDTEQDSDCSDDHSAHSLTQRACQEKYREVESDQHSNSKVRRATCPRSPVHSSRSVREESPIWDIEETTLSSPSSTKSAGHPPVILSLPIQADAIVGTERFAWASRLHKSGPHTPAAPVNTKSTTRSFSTEDPPQTRTSSAYFMPTDAQKRRQVPTAPLSELDELEDKQASHQNVSYSIGPLDSANPPSTPECLQLEHARLPFSSEAGYMRVADEGLSENSAFYIQPYSSLGTGNFQGDVIHDERFTEDLDPREEMRSYSPLGPAEYMELPSGYAHNNSDVLTWNEWIPSHSAFSLEEENFEIHSNTRRKEVPFRSGVKYLDRDVGRPYEEAELMHEDAEYLDSGTGEAYMLQYQSDIDYREDAFSEEASDYDLCVGATREQELHDPTEWPTNDSVECVNPIHTEPESDALDQGDPTEVGDEWTERAPSLLRVITETSLQDDLIKSMSGHWNAAHRLY